MDTHGFCPLTQSSVKQPFCFADPAHYEILEEDRLYCLCLPGMASETFPESPGQASEEGGWDLNLRTRCPVVCQDR